MHDKVSRFQSGIRSLLVSCVLVCMAPFTSLRVDEPDGAAAWAHGNETHAEPMPDTASNPAVDTLTGRDVTALVRAFTNGLDSVYTSLSGTYLGIEPILKKSCYDCHSDQTHYPWYYRIPGIRGMIDNDIREAREHLDCSRGFPFGGHASQEEQLEEIREEIEEGAMPLRPYRLTHWNTLIEGTARDSVFQWIDSSLAAIRRVKAQFGIEEPEAGQTTVYICPMCSDIIARAPGLCPRCGMDLEPREVER